MYHEYWNDLELGEIIVAKFNRVTNGKTSGKITGLPNFNRLKGLYVDFRPFFQTSDPTSFIKIATMINERVESPLYCKFIEFIEKQWNDNLSIPGSFKWNDKPLIVSEVLNIFFNGYIFHSDNEKYNKLLDLLNSFEEETIQSLLFCAVQGCFMAVNNLYRSISELTPENLKVTFPLEFID